MSVNEAKRTLPETLNKSSFQRYAGVASYGGKALHEHIALMPVDATQAFVLDVRAIRHLAITHGYGHSVKLERVSNVRGVAGNLAKYVSKACDERPEVPWVIEATGEIRRAAYRPRSASRGWGLRMAEILEHQRAWAQANVLLDPNTQTYTRTLSANQTFGHDDAEALVRAVFGDAVEVAT